MTREGRKRLLIACICIFFICVTISVFVTRHLPNPDIWNTIVCVFGALDWIAIYLIIRPAVSREGRRLFDGFIVVGVLFAIPGTVCILWLGTTNWSNHPNLTRFNMYWGLALMIALVAWIKIPRKEGTH